MSKPTFLSPDQSQVELRICPRRTITGWLLIILSPVFILGLLFTAGVFWNEWFQSNDDVSQDFAPFTVLLMLSVLIGFLVLDVFIFLTDDLLVLTREGLFYRQRGFINKKRHFKLSSILGIEQTWPQKNCSQIKINLSDQATVNIANLSWVPKKSQEVFVEECEEFLQRHKLITWVQTPEGESAEKLVDEIDLKTDDQFNYPKPIDSKWTQDTTASEFTISRKEKFSWLIILAWIGGFIGFYLVYKLGLHESKELYDIYCGKDPNHALTTHGVFVMYFIFFWTKFLCPIMMFVCPVIAVSLFLNDLLNIIRWKRVRYFVFTRNEIRLISPLMGFMQNSVYDVSRVEKLKIQPYVSYYIDSGDDRDPIEVNPCCKLLFIGIGKGRKEETLCEIVLASAAEARWLAAEYQRIYASSEN